MERIQSALAKARAARNGRSDPQATMPGGPISGDAVAQTAWAALHAARIDPARLRATRIVAHQAGPEADSFDLMRTNLLRQLREHNWTRVAVTSPTSGCGKTTTCLNLAFSLARQTDLRIMALELDLRRPMMMRTLGLNGVRRFAGVLDGSAVAERQLLRWGENLAFGVNSMSVSSPAELLSSARAAAAVDAIERTYRPDVILFDMPPVLVGDDTLAFLDQVDCALMIAAAEQSTLTALERCGKELAQHTKELGVVLNKCRFPERTESYGYDRDR
jgi:Mrp family chromosome partitioning ATPase